MYEENEVENAVFMNEGYFKLFPFFNKNNRRGSFNIVNSIIIKMRIFFFFFLSGIGKSDTERYEIIE